MKMRWRNIYTIQLLTRIWGIITWVSAFFAASSSVLVASVKLSVIRGSEDVERALKVPANLHCRSGIVVLGSIVRCREEGDESTIGEEFGPILDNLQIKKGM